MAKETKNEVRFIRDKPAAEDFFGSHGKVAQALFRLITDYNDVRVIGLLGSWGSGKSTIVELLKKQLTDTDTKKGNTFLFIYDA